MAKVVACIIARTVSTRLPLKVLRDVSDGISMIDFLIERVKSVKEIDEVYLCTSREPVDDILEDIAVRQKIKIYRGAAEEVIERMISVGKIEQSDILIRITGDNPFASIEYIPKQISLLLNKKLDYVRVVDLPIGATTEVITFKALEQCYKTMDPAVSEYLMLFLFEPNNFKCGIIKAFKDDYSLYSLTVDTPDDLVRTKGMLKLMVAEPAKILLKDIVSLYTKNLQLPAVKVKGSGIVKLPYGKEISFDDFNIDMNRRKQHSQTLNLYE